MAALKYARQRLEAFLSEVERVAQSEFPYEDSRAALHLVQDLFKRHLNTLESLDEGSDPATVEQACSTSLRALFDYLPLLGFILRSTNIRNAFEVVRPLRRLACDLLEPSTPKESRRTRLVLSSEWDYSPFTYVQIPQLRGFVLIGLPASESGNPLVLPLAGHEIGHSLWVERKKKDTYRIKIHSTVVDVVKATLDEYNRLSPNPDVSESELETDMFVLETLSPAMIAAIKQVEETFCDMVGLRIFGTSFLYAFAYLLAPSPRKARSISYPSIKTRVANLMTGATTYGIAAPPDYVSHFEQQSEPYASDLDRYLLRVADSALSTLLAELINDAQDEIGENAANGADEDKVLRKLHLVIPGEGAKSLAAILGAGWRAAEDGRLWIDAKLPVNSKSRVLRELVLKSVEVLDIEQTLEEGQ